MSHPLDIPDEYPIAEIPDTPWWSENYALMGSDAALRSALFFGCGRWHGDRSIWRELIVVALPDGRVIFAKGYGRNGDAKGPGGAFAKLDVLEPGRKLRLTYDGPVWQSTNAELFAHGFRDGATRRCTIDLLFESDQPVWNMKGDSPGAAHIAGAIHIDHIGKVNATIAYEGETYRYTDGFSVRDHSRGPREISPYKAHCWTQGHFPEHDTAFYVYAMNLQGLEGLGMSNATVVRGGKFHPAKIIHIEMPRRVEDVLRPGMLVLASDLGEMKIEVKELITHVVTGVVKPYDTVPGGKAGQSSAVVVDGPTRVQWDGKQGLGWSELGFTAAPL